MTSLSLHRTVNDSLFFTQVILLCLYLYFLLFLMSCGCCLPNPWSNISFLWTSIRAAARRMLRPGSASNWTIIRFESAPHFFAKSRPIPKDTSKLYLIHNKNVKLNVSRSFGILSTLRWCNWNWITLNRFWVIASYLTKNVKLKT